MRRCSVDELDEVEFLEGLPPLVRASRTGDLGEVSSLLAQGVSPAAAESDGWSALHAAASRNHTEIIRVLLEAGCPVDVMDDSGFTPLLNAAGPGNTETISRLLAAGADPNVREYRLLQTPLLRAADYGNAEVAQLLIDAGARIDDKSRGATALMTAAESSDGMETVRVLLQAGADPRITDDGSDEKFVGMTAADYARRMGNTLIADFIDAWK
ncbi:ankyrin repeat domain-containing protein [Paenarthrobacter nitroguajacolicus]|uniref:Ankyrin repeat domain-containing protein n=1 Tax=Paenarthrobacter nitroguajacolicus TaxID=211146 RepID=A0A558H6U9_PAENT|nr:ankyrin repeat domain-containing protein [Paenarthrobacter nitroguajacolicus]